MVWIKKVCDWFFNRTKSDAQSVIASASINSHLGFQARVIRAEPGEGQRITIRRAGWFETTASTELDTARRFVFFSASPLTEFTKAPENDDVDIVAKSADGVTVQELQVTRLWDGPFWKKLKETNAVDIDLTRDQLFKLIQDAVERKGERKYTLQRRKQLILLIDTNPDGVRPELAPAIRSGLTSQLERASLKQVWLVGPDKENTFEITPPST